MNLVEKHIINNKHPYYIECDSLCFKSKNIYNLSLYKIKEDLLKNDYDTLNRLFHHMKNENCFKLLPMKIATATIIQVQKNFKAYFKAIKEYNINQNKFNGKPKQPNYLNKVDGRFIVSYNNQAISKMIFKKEQSILLSGTKIKLYTKIDNFNKINCVRIIPKLDSYVIEICYSIDDVKQIRDNKKYASIDLGLNNLVTLTTNINYLSPIIFNGKPLKSINQYYNKKYSHYKSKLELINKKKKSKKINKLTNKRNYKIEDYLHKTSKIIIDNLQNNKISKLVIGKNDNWKQNIKISKKINQNFVSIPHNKLISMLEYKCIKCGIKVILQEESYTSKASFLNLDPIPVLGKNEIEKFSGYRISRGIYKIKGEKKYINADVNGSYNILRKAIPNAFVNGIEGVVVHPLVIQPKIN